VLKWFNTSDFVAPPLYSFGNSGRNILFGPGTAQFDILLFKSILNGDGSRYLQLRAEAFNAFNHPQFNGADLAQLFASEHIDSTRALADRVTEALMRKIVGKELPAGAQLPCEQMMAQSFGVSPTVIREAVSRLKSEGLIDTK
jgi:hypothetical protein